MWPAAPPRLRRSRRPRRLLLLLLVFTRRGLCVNNAEKAVSRAMPGWNAGATSGNPLTTGQPNRGASYKVHEVQQRVDAVKGIMYV